MTENYSFAEKKRIRKSFEKISSVMSLPDILEIQTDSYKYFLQSDIDSEKRKDQGLEQVFKSIFPIVSVSGNAKIDYLKYELSEPEFDVLNVSPGAELMKLLYISGVELLSLIKQLEKRTLKVQEMKRYIWALCP